MKFVDLDKSLLNGIDCVYYIYGEDSYLVKRAFDKIKSILNLQFEDINSNKYILDKGVISQAISACYLSTIIDEKRLVVIDDYQQSIVDSEKKTDEFRSYLDNPNVCCCLVIISKDLTIPKIFSYCTIVDCNKLDSPVIIKWIRAQCKRMGKTISYENASVIAEYCSHSMTLVNCEVEKLCGYVEGTGITLDDINNTVNREIEVVAFALSNAITNKDTHKALELLDFVLSRGAKDDDPNILIAQLYGAYRRMFLVSVSKALDNELSQSMKVSVKAIEHARRSAKNFTPIKLRKALKILTECEEQLKDFSFNSSDRIRLTVLQLLNL